MPLEHIRPAPIRLPVILGGRQDLQIAFAMQATNEFRYQRNNVVDVMRNAGFARQPRRLDIDRLDRRQICPYWRRALLCRVTLCRLRVDLRLIRFAPSLHAGELSLALLGIFCAAVSSPTLAVLGKPSRAHLFVALAIRFAPCGCRCLRPFWIGRLVRRSSRLLTFAIGIVKYLIFLGNLIRMTLAPSPPCIPMLLRVFFSTFAHCCARRFTLSRQSARFTSHWRPALNRSLDCYAAVTTGQIHGPFYCTRMLLTTTF